MTTSSSTIEIARARRSLGHPGYGWIDAQPAIQPRLQGAVEACDLLPSLHAIHAFVAADGVTVSMQRPLTNTIANFLAGGGKGAREGTDVTAS